MKTCRLCQNAFEVPEDTSAFVQKMAFQFGVVQVPMPEPDLCPDCGNQVRTAHRNERNLYHRKSDLSGKNMVSIYTPDAPWGDPYTVYSYDEWHGDGWDPMDYGRDFYFSRPFFEQWFELYKAVPRLGLIAVDNENSPYTTGTAYSKNCHLINSSEHCQDCYYGKLLQNCTDCVDGSYIYDSELCYECFSIRNCYNCKYVSMSKNSSDCWFSDNLIGCKNCFLCTDLNNKEYYFLNEPLGKEEYEQRVAEFVGSHRNIEKAKQMLKQLKKDRLYKYANILNSEDCTGDFIDTSKNCQNCYDLTDSEDCRNVWVGVNIKDTYECSNMYLKQELNYQVLGTIGTHRVAYSSYIFNSSNILYSDHIFNNSSDLFGCIGLKKKSYCILNTQYSKEAYEALVPQIIEHMKRHGEWGKFFPVEQSPHAYNETLAHEYYPMEQQVVLDRGWNWKDDHDSTSAALSMTDLPDHIDDVHDAITQQVLQCEVTGKPYKIIPQELAFYRKLKLPIPRRCPDQRHVDRMALRNPRRLHERSCTVCEQHVMSVFADDRPEAIACEACYLKAQ